MGATPSKSQRIRREFLRYALPSVAGMLVSSLYTVVDGVFVGHGVGELALGGVNIVFPFIMLVIALTMLIAVGGANLVSFHRGRRQPAEANNLFCQSVALLLGTSAALAIGSYLFSRQICVFLGADDQLLPFAEAYLRCMSLFVAVQMVGLGLSVFLRNDNSPNLAMVGTVSGAVVNIVLDYVFIMVWDWGIEGAAIATGIGISLEFVVYLSHFVMKKGELRFARPAFSLGEIGRLLYNGLSSFLMEFCQSAIAVSFNLVIIDRLGPMGVAAYGIVTYIGSSFNMILIGITQGAQPILSYNHGRGDADAVKRIRALGNFSCLAASALFIAACLALDSLLVGMFCGDSPQLMKTTREMLAYFCVGYLPVGLTLMNILFFQTTEREGRSTLLSVMRCVGFVQAFLLILPRWWGDQGIYLAFLCGEICNWLVSAALYAAVEEPGISIEDEVQPAYVHVTGSSARRSARISQRLRKSGA